MRFFSNESKETNDDEVAQARDEHPEHVQSDPVAVPPQRAGSPWSSGPNGDDTPPPFTAPTASAVDPSDRDDTRPLPTAGERPGEEDPVDVSLDDRGTFEDPQVEGEPRTVEDTTPPDAPSESPSDTSDISDTSDESLKDDGDFDDPKAVEPATGEALDSTESRAAADPVPAESEAAADPAESPAAADPAPEPAAAAVAPTVATLFGADAQSFRDRWRDVQLRFVDSPKEATAEAATMVDEAVERLTNALKDQKANLTGGGDDTEKLRVELRGYRELLNRILDL